MFLTYKMIIFWVFTLFRKNNVRWGFFSLDVFARLLYYLNMKTPYLLSALASLSLGGMPFHMYYPPAAPGCGDTAATRRANTGAGARPPARPGCGCRPSRGR